MTIQKHVVVDKIEIIENGTVQVRECSRFVEDGIIVSSTFFRKTIAPGNDYSSESERVQAICAATHTPEVIKAYKTAIAVSGI